MKMRYYIIAMIVFAFLMGCTAPVEKPLPSLSFISPREYPVFKDDLDLASLERAVSRSLEYYNRLPETRIYYFGNAAYTVAELKDSLISLLPVVRASNSAETVKTKIGETFDVYKASGADGKGTVLFTGYYAPVLEGSPVKTPEYRYPIYRTPDDHVVIDLERFHSKYKGEKVVGRVEDGMMIPYYTRNDIDVEECLQDKGLEIAWFADPVDIFFLHIQGSGIVRFPDGSLLRVSYDKSNGHPYRSIGRFLVDEGKISMEEVSLKSIKRYLRDHPEEMFRVLGHNESYVFFRIVDEGPVGSLNIPVTAGRTIATDASVFPKGAIAFISTRKPIIDGNGAIESWISFSRFVLNQDTGGAINGPGRVDLFCGQDRYAEVMAGHLKEEGELYFLVKKRTQ